ncbi:PorT family protein [Niabella pedocola]|uniref:PorT family protein n=1 Tax=Niabella pedocola TaxID=1752077 RepID=A0ABS8PR56_9BACT|nr:porin family protein [Niabella pedocola]MCD2422753.1 PorT family protein [Niabella pedocola]
MKKKNQLLKAFMVAAAVSISGAAMSQVEIGIRAGANFSNATIKDANDNKVDTKLNPGWHAGVTFDIPVADEFYVQPGALFSTKGFKTDNSYFGGNANINGKASASYIEVPVNFLYKPELGSGKLLLGAGPYVAYGVGGKWDAKASGGNASISSDGSLEFKGDSKDASGGDKLVYGKPFDAGANLLFGYEFANKLSFQLNGQLGLLNIEPKNDGKKPDAKMKNTGFGISVGYKF